MAYSSSDLHGVLRFVAGARSRVHGRFHIAGAAVNHGFHGENLDGHFREFFFHQAEIANLFAEGFALFGIFGSGHAARAWNRPRRTRRA